MTTTARPGSSAVTSPHSIELPVVPVGALLDGAARRFGDRPALVHHDDVLTYRGLWAEACGIAHALVARGIRPGDVVALHLPNRLAWPIAYHGILLAGATVALASPALPRELLDAQLADAGAVAVVSLDPSLENVITTDGRRLDLPVEEHDTPPWTDLDPAVALAHLAYTGGTTGRSKGVELTHANVVANVLQYVATSAGAVPAPDVQGGVTVEQTSPPEEHPVRLGEAVSLAVAPWFHAMGTNGLTIGLVTGTTAVVQDRFDPAAYLADVERHRATTLSGAPAMYHALLAHPDAATRDLSSVRTVTSGASPMAVAQAERIAALMPGAVVVEGYGLTEATMGLCISPSERSATRRIGTVGLPVANTELVLLPVETGRPGDEPVALGERGEIWARGPQVMQRYHDRPDETAAGLVDGWLRTGDIGILGEDGYLSVVDRAKDMLLYKGYNVFPRELEELLAARPEVAAAAVVGLPDDAVGELPTAAVVLAPGTTGTAGLEALAAAVNAAVRPYERLRRIYTVDALPVSAAGKVLKGDLRETLLAAPDGPAWTDGAS
ncbi:class I adenylate-forming enzyme family protein [Actinomycetospora sp. TBRC 11914]|uniref:class I adenylate-forming enzyme family protein n=1 Tax=Actinomycetospora sp. TBRC 11914 TaxID=2729387 RepID=UPI00145F9885|nr:AMP-binding protein [Actinomycetospora sp. TBRC 11914]NMO94064.1 long-chain fatty acid--CoA ligase [Actinomycetospora sp. TBRC 11914]